MPISPRLKTATRSQASKRRSQALNASAIRVLIVDDSRLEAERSRLELLRAGVSSRCLIVEDLVSLAEELHDFAPDVVVCELQSAGFDGFAAQRIVRELRPETPLIFMASSSVEEVGERIIQSGAADYVQKANLSRLPATVRRVLRAAKGHVQVDTMPRAPNVRSRGQVERLEALWKIAGAEGSEPVSALIREAVGRMGHGRAHFGLLGHVEGAEFAIDVVLGELGAEKGAAFRVIRAGARLPVSEAIEACSRRAGVRSQISTRFDAGGKSYTLMLGSLASPEPQPYDAEDYTYVEAVGSILARSLEHEQHKAAVLSAEFRSRRHAERIEALWRIFNSTNLRGEELVQAMLREGSAAMRPQQSYAGTLGHVDGDDFVLDAVAGEAGPADGPARRGLPVGFRGKLSDSLIARDLSSGRTKSWDDVLAVPDLPARTRAAGIRTQITTQFVADGTVYVLSLGSLEPQTVPFSPEDHDYIEVLASMFARQIELEASEKSLRESELRSRRHAQRLDALWQIANNPSLAGLELIVAMLEHGAAAIRPQQSFIGVLSRIDGNEVVVIAEGTPRDNHDPRVESLHVGRILRVEETLIPLFDRTRAWEDLATLGISLPFAESSRGWRALIATTFHAGGARYSLGFGSPEPTSVPFNAEDNGYLDVLASTFAKQLQVNKLEESLRDEEEHSRQHAERLEALWQIINNANLHGDDLINAMLRQAATSVRPGHGFDGILARIQGSAAIVEALTGSGELAFGALPLKVGTVIPLVNTSLGRILDEGGGTRSFDDVENSAYTSEVTRARGTHSLILTTFVAGTATWTLAFTSKRSTRKPLGPHDHAYVEVLASFFSSHLQQRWQFDRIQYQQSYDVLTGLLNRSTFRSRARLAARTSERYALIFVDVDGLHEINESFGQLTGDAVLVEVGHALLQRALGNEIVGRLSGDVFAIYVPDASSREALLARVADFSGAFAQGFSTGDREGKEFIARTACIGIAAAPEDGTRFESILSRADAALTTAKERGHGSTVFYVAGMEAEAQRRATLHNELREAIARDQFTLYFQPHVEIKTGRVTGCEALIRWNHPVRGLLLPAQFIPFAEQTGLITSIDAWVMSHAFTAAHAMRALRADFRLYFNLSGRQAGDPKMIRAFTDAARNGLALENIGVEITETDAMRDVDATRHVCRALRRLNVRIAIDDFGTGYSSLSSLKRLPVDIVKIDRAFVSGLLNDRHDQTITETIISIADHFGFETLAEGLEQPEELEWLRRRACRYVQGMLVCHPLPFEDFKAWLLEHDADSP